MRGLRFLLKRSGGRATEDVFKVAELVHAIAKNHLGIEGKKLERLRTLKSNIREKLPPREMTEKNKSVLRCFRDKELVKSLLCLPHKLTLRFQKDKSKNSLIRSPPC